MKPIAIETFLEFQFVSDPTFSPDGRWIAFVVSATRRAENDYAGDLYLYDLTQRQVRRLTAGGDAKSYAWTAQNTLLFPAMRDAKAKEEAAAGKELSLFYEISPEGGEAVEVLRLPYQALGLQVLPDGRWLVKVLYDNARETRKKNYEVVDELPFWFNGMGFTNAKRSRYLLVDPRTGAQDFLADEWTDCGACSVCGDRLLYAATPWKQSVQGLDAGLYLYHLDTGETETLFAPDTLRVEAFALLSETEAVLNTTGAASADLNEYCDLYKLDLATKALTLCREYDACVGGGSVGTDARHGGGRGQKALDGSYYFLSTVEDFTRLWRLAPDGALAGPLTAGSSCDSFDVNGGHLVSCEFRVLAADGGPALAELYLDGEQITHFSDGLAAEYSVCLPEPLVFSAADGTALHGWVLKPAGYTAGASYPGILHIHGGPRTVFSDVFHHEMQLWANAGYFVFYCNPRGSDGRGTAFGDINGRYGTVDYDDLMAFTDEVLRRYPAVDRARLGVTGGSYGGFMTNWIVGHTDRFAAAVSQRSIANWVSFEHNSDIGPMFTPHNQKSTTRQDPALLWEQSPLKYAPNCKTPLLLIHSDEDYRCYMAEGFAMYSAVKRNGCPAKLCLFHGENHELSRSGKPENRIDRMREILAWMDLYLK